MTADLQIGSKAVLQGRDVIPQAMILATHHGPVIKFIPKSLFKRLKP